MNPLLSAISRYIPRQNRKRGRIRTSHRKTQRQRVCLEVLEDRSLLSPYMVTTTADSGAGSLRDAINQINADTSHALYASSSNPNVDEIDFATTAASDAAGGGTGYNATTGVATIQPLSALPTITDAVFIDGSTQPGYSGTPLIELNGVDAGGGAFGLDITSGNCTMRGLAIDQFANTAIKLSGGGGNLIEGNYIGTDANGDAGLGNGSGVNIAGSSGNTIGGTAPGDGNVISGNSGGGGIFINGTGATGNLVQGNLIGTTLNGAAALANYAGVVISSGAAHNTIGGATAAARNIISGNNVFNIWLTNSGTSNNVVEGDYVGTDVTGEAAITNYEVDILIDAGAHDNLIGTDGNGSPDQIQAERNLISGSQNFSPGIRIAVGCSNNVVAGNYIGTDLTGTKSLSNTAGLGIDLSGDHNFIGTTAAGVAEAATRNVISGNGFAGIDLGGNHNVVAGNFIGTDPTGMHANLNASYGIYMGGGQYNQIGTNGDGVNDAAEGNVIDSGVNNILVDSVSFNVIAGNLIGTDVTGTVVLAANSEGIKLDHGAHDNRIGASASDIDPAAERNVISGHDLAIDSDPGGSANTIAGNLIGSDITGLLPLGNTNGIQINDSGDQILDNLISAASGGELGIGGSGNLVAGNLIGTDITGTASLGGGVYDGVSIGGSNNTIGGTNAGARNIICGYARAGVSIYGVGATGNVVEGNFIGTDVTGTKALGNGPGVRIDGASGNTIGGTTAGAGNTIAYNNSNGVFLDGGSSNSILDNSIHDNGGLGISFRGGANNNQAAPVLTSATSTSSGTTVSGTLTSVANTTFRIEFFSNNGLDASGNAEGLTYLGFALVTTDANGYLASSPDGSAVISNPDTANASFKATNLPAIPAGQGYLTATATNQSTGDTSQFSNYLAAPTSTVLTSSANPSLLNQSVTFTATVSSSFGTPTGSVDFVDTTTNTDLGSVALSSNGTASITVSNLALGAHGIKATYAGQGSFLGSSGTLSQQVDYKFSGFLPPLSNGLSFGVNRTIPVQFQLADANGNAITSLSAVTSLQIQALDANGNPEGAPFAPASTNKQGLQYTSGQYQFNWQTKGLAAGSYQIVLKLADGTTQTKTIQLASNGSGGNAQSVDGSDVSGGNSAGQLLGGNVELYVDNSNGDLTPDELARIQDAINAVDATIAPYGVAINEVTDPTQADVTLTMGTNSAVGGYAQGILGCYNTTGAITLIQGWNWYAGSDPTQIGASQYDFQTTVTHELGHALGLGESSVTTSAMYGTLAPATVIRSLTTADLNIPYDEGPSDPQRAAVPAARTVAGPVASNNPTNGQGMSAPSSGSPLSPADQLFANFTLVLNEMRNGNQPTMSSVAALWQSIDALALQRLDAWLSMEAGAMGVTKDTLTRDYLFASSSAPSGA